MVSRKERLILLDPGHRRGEHTGFYNSEEWLTVCGKEGKNISAERERERKKRRYKAMKQNVRKPFIHSHIDWVPTIYVSKLFQTFVINQLNKRDKEHGQGRSHQKVTSEQRGRGGGRVIHVNLWGRALQAEERASAQVAGQEPIQYVWRTGGGPGELKGSVQEAEWSRQRGSSKELLELRMNVCALEWGREQKEG